MDEFPSRLLLALKALSLSRGRLAAELAVDKSVVSRWLSGRQTPSGENLAKLTALIAARRPAFTLLDWESDIAAFQARLVPPAPAESPYGAAGGWLPDSVLEEARTLTALRGDAYEGFWRTTRPAIGLPGRFMHDRVMIRRAASGYLAFRLQVEDMRFEGWAFPTQTQLFALAVDGGTGIFIFAIFNAVVRHRAEVLDGLTLTVQRLGGGAPVAGAILMERLEDLSGDEVVDEATYRDFARLPTLAPPDAISPELRDHLFRDVGPAALLAGGSALLAMPFAETWSRGPRIPPEAT